MPIYWINLWLGNIFIQPVASENWGTQGSFKRINFQTTRIPALNNLHSAEPRESNTLQPNFSHIKIWLLAKSVIHTSWHTYKKSGGGGGWLQQKILTRSNVQTFISDNMLFEKLVFADKMEHCVVAHKLSLRRTPASAMCRHSGVSFQEIWWQTHILFDFFLWLFYVRVSSADQI